MSLLTKLTAEVQAKSQEPLRYGRASLFHGVLMGNIDPTYASKLHLDGLRPYSQCVYQVDEKNYWQICTLNREAKDCLLTPVLSDEFDQFTFFHNGEEVQILGKNVETSSIDELVEKYYFGDCARYLTLRFATPTAFKQAGAYVFYPDIGLIYQSLINRFNQYAESQMITAEETLDDLCKNAVVTGYRLHSVSFPLEGISIPAFLGTLQIKFKGPAPLVNLAHLLFHYGEYSGVGIKTALGMGKIEVIERGRRKHVD